MNEYRGEQKAIGRQWLLGCLPVAAVLGHDLAMAAPAISPLDAALVHHAATPPRHALDRAASEGDRPEPDQLVDCRVGQAAVVRGGDGWRLADRCAGSALSAFGPANGAASSVGASTWEEPRWPPGMQRAFLQIYRL